MISNSYFLVISLFLLSVVSGEHFIERQANGDLLYGPDLDCTAHGANQVTNGKCVCPGSGTYFTDRNGKSNCFKGRGEAELGKSLVCIIFI